MATIKKPAPRRVPDATEDLGVVDGLVQLSFAVQAMVGAVTARFDCSIIQTRLLGALRDRELSMAQIARLLTLDKSSVTGLVDRAEGRGYVKRTTTVEDGRSILVTLTSEGRGIINKVALDVAREIHSIADRLSDTERARLSQTASKLVHLDAAARGIDLQTGRRESAVSSRKGA